MSRLLFRRATLNGFRRAMDVAQSFQPITEEENRALLAQYLFTSLRDLWIQPPEDIAGETESFRLP